MGLLEENKLMVIAAGGSLILHAAVLLGAGLAFSNKEEAFPKPAPRKVTLLSISRSNPAPEIKEIKKIAPEKINKPVPRPPVIEGKKPAVTRNPQPEERTEHQTEISGNNEHDEPADESKTAESSFGTGNTSASINEPAPLTPIEPDYPFKARKKGIEGSVRLSVFVDKTGIPISCTILKPSGNADLDRASEKAVMRASFSPKTVNGRKTEGTVEITILFKLKD